MLKVSIKNLFILMILVFISLFSCTRAGDDVIKIGIIGPMQFSQGMNQYNGAVIAEEEINNAGGIQVGDVKKKIKIIKADSNEFANITDASNAMERLITMEKVDFILGGFRSEAVLAMQDIAMDYKKIFIGDGASADELCTRVGENYERYKYFFRGTPINSTNLARNSFIHLGYAAAVVGKTLKIPLLKVAIVAEKAEWSEKLVAAAKGVIPKMGMEVAGVWQPSTTATDVTAELTAIQSSGAHLIYTAFSSSVGITFTKQYGELKIPSLVVGINVMNEKSWEVTEGNCNYVIYMTNFIEDAPRNETAKKFMQAYRARYGELPTYPAGTYFNIKDTLGIAIEKAGTLDADTLVPLIEKDSHEGGGGILAFDKNHDLLWGPQYSITLGAQWQDGEIKCVWPNKWKASDAAPEVSVPGVVPIKLPPWMIDTYQK